MNTSRISLGSCANCNAKSVDSLFCTECGYVLVIPGEVNYFDLFHVKQKLWPETKALQSAYFELQSAMHPDRFTNKSDAQQQIAISNSSVINHAYMVLSNKFECAKYLINLHTACDDELPMDFMALSFELHERKLEGEDIMDEVKALEASLWAALTAFTDADDWKEAASLLAKIKIIGRLIG